MSEQPTQPPTPPTPPPTPPPPEILAAIQAAQRSFRQSANYRVVFSNFFKMRVGPGDLSIVFGAYTDTPASLQGVVQQDEVCVSMSWPQVKALNNALTSTIEAIEKLVGPTPISELGLPVNIDAVVKQTLAGFGFANKK